MLKFKNTYLQYISIYQIKENVELVEHSPLLPIWNPASALDHCLNAFISKKISVSSDYVCPQLVNFWEILVSKNN